MQRILRAGAVVYSVVAAAPAFSETLSQAWAEALATNPGYAIARANVRDTAADLDIARAAGKPNLSANGIAQRSFGQRSTFSNPVFVRQGGLQLQLPLYAGGRVREAVRAARTRVDVRVADLHAEEGDLLIAVVQAYVDVLRTARILDLHRNQIEVLKEEVTAARARLRGGDATRTDVSQAAARLEAARAQASLADADAVAARETYRRVIGHLPGDLAQPDPLPPLPATTDDAMRVALAERPELAAAKANRLAARFDTRAARAERLPRLNFIATAGYGNQSNNVRGSRPDLRVGLQLSVPLFQGGRLGARVRQAGAQEAAAIEDVVLTERQVVADVRTNFARQRIGEVNIAATDAARVASGLAARSIHEELKAGDRDTIDVLNAQQEALSAQVAYVNAQSDTYTAGARLLRSMGRAADILPAGAQAQEIDGRKVLAEGLAFDLRDLTGSRPASGKAPERVARIGAEGLQPIGFDLAGLI